MPSYKFEDCSSALAASLDAVVFESFLLLSGAVAFLAMNFASVIDI
jgi:hypothetical protein